MEAFDFIKKHHSDAKNYIVFTELLPPEQEGAKRKWKESSFTVDTITPNNRFFKGADKFFSLNSFNGMKRNTNSIRHLRALYIDLDCYNVHMTPRQTLTELEEKHFNKTIPEPNAVIFTGRGLDLIWWIYHAPKQAMKTWERVTDSIYETLVQYGADAHCKDPARVFRIPGTINSKNGKQVQAITLHDNKYYLGHLLEELNPWPVYEKQDIKKSLQPKKKTGKSPISLYWRRVQDLITLQRMRNETGVTEGYREYSCFLFRYHMVCLTGDVNRALDETLKFNSNFAEPLKESEVVNSTKNADIKGLAWLRDFRNYELHQKRANKTGEQYFFTHKTIMERLNITDEEQRCLVTFITPEEKKERDKLAKRRVRREQGVLEREQYLKQQKNKTDNHLVNLELLLEENPDIKNKEIVERLGISLSRVHQLKRKLKNKGV